MGQRALSRKGTTEDGLIVLRRVLRCLGVVMGLASSVQRSIADIVIRVPYPLAEGLISGHFRQYSVAPSFSSLHAGPLHVSQ